MKRSSQIFSIVIITATMSLLFSCKKDIQVFQSDLKGNSSKNSGIEVVSSPNYSKTSSGYVGTGTLGDSTSKGR